MAATISCVPVQTIPVGLEGSQLCVLSGGTCILFRASSATSSSSSFSSSSSSSSSSTTTSSSSTTYVTISPSVTSASSISSSSCFSTLSSKTVAQQVQALRPLRKQIQPQTSDEPPALRCKRRVDLSKLGYSVPKPQPGAVARRNERERNRVKQVNRGFDTLRQHVPAGRKNKKMSKVDTLRNAVDYIRELISLLEEDGVEPTPFLAPSTPLSPQDSLGSCPSPSTHCSSPSDGSLSPGGSYDSSGESFPSPTSTLPSPGHWASQADHMEGGERSFQDIQPSASTLFDQMNIFQKAEAMDSLGTALAALHPTLDDALDESFDDLDSSDSSMKDEADSIESLSPTLHELRPMGEDFAPGFGALDAFPCLTTAQTNTVATLQNDMKVFTSSSSSSTSSNASMIFSSSPAPAATFPPLSDVQPQQEPQFLKQEEAPSCCESVIDQDSVEPHSSPMPMSSPGNGCFAMEAMQPVYPALLSSGAVNPTQQEASEAMTATFDTIPDLSRFVQEDGSNSISLTVAAMMAQSLAPHISEMTPSDGQCYLDSSSTPPPAQTLTPSVEMQDLATLADDDVLAISRWLAEQICLSSTWFQDCQRVDNVELSRDR